MKDQADLTFVQKKLPAKVVKVVSYTGCIQRAALQLFRKYPCVSTILTITHGQIVGSNIRYVHPAVTPSAALQLNRRLHPHTGIKGCGDRTIVCGVLDISVGPPCYRYREALSVMVLY